ncbi:PAQR family membrane homeostasis protein TrhA [Thiohalophilus thiocyanatoxydans]|uniref:Hemolysin III n=1 Tax=Thiohalophilus thiocyanatoxydans TaxID=381308 RepID=A0A4R8IFL1_9GAMM|nr:hemolysin III family protein [Thiohalophilus thiocyanatoxydans]TDX99310.1 hemolysin III [Thiohalophilus thiocyanatoxydans]
MQKGERFNTISHLVGATLALAGVVALLVVATNSGDGFRIVSFSVYGATLFLLYLISTLYHGLGGRAKRVFRILDHQAIYLLIAGSYTPFTLVTLHGSVGWWLFGAIWGMAVLGIVIDGVFRDGRRVVPFIIYFVMGWLILVALKPLLAGLPLSGFVWLLVGGLFYSGGVVFFALDSRYPWMHGLWHLCVLAGSVSHYVAILIYV